MLILVRRAQICNTLIVSTLASCQKLPATVPDLANRPRQLVFLTPLNSQLNDFLNEVHQIARLEPSIVERIDEDLDLHAKKKKLLRLQRSARPVVAGGVHHAQTLAQSSGAGITARQHPEREPQRGQ